MNLAEEHAAGAALKHYFVDESGDPTLFGKRGKVLVGSPGCSRYFIMGFLDVRNPAALRAELEQLRAEVLADPYFQGVYSLRPDQRKTAIEFHAKDDLPEIRKLVLDRLLGHDLRFYAVVRDKGAFVNWVKNTNRQSVDYHFRPSEMYDSLIRRLFRDYLHKDDAYQIVFARRGSKERSKALADALGDARRNFARKWGIVSEGKISVCVSSPPKEPGLQAADYFLWALQRLYERREERFVTLLWSRFSLVHDLDDTRQARYGVYYTKKKPLTLAAIKDSPGI